MPDAGGRSPGRPEPHLKRRRQLRAATGWLVVPAAGLGAYCLVPREPTLPLPRPSASAAPEPKGARIIYPANETHTLALPDGQERVVRSMLNVARPLRFGDYVWNDEGVPPGEAWVWVDLDRQTLSVFRGGHEIGSAVILYGTDGSETPTGVFPILAKAVEHRSNLYDAEMPYMLRLTNDGVAVHASNVREGAATHGCIGVPIEFARLLYAAVARGDVIAIRREDGTRDPSTRRVAPENS